MAEIIYFEGEKNPRLEEVADALSKILRTRMLGIGMKKISYEKGITTAEGITQRKINAIPDCGAIVLVDGDGSHLKRLYNNDLLQFIDFYNRLDRYACDKGDRAENPSFVEVP